MLISDTKLLTALGRNFSVPSPSFAFRDQPASMGTEQNQLRLHLRIRSQTSSEPQTVLGNTIIRNSRLQHMPLVQHP
jgi:hypothetical protein